jgi:hypothetical protein
LLEVLKHASGVGAVGCRRPEGAELAERRATEANNAFQLARCGRRCDRRTRQAPDVANDSRADRTGADRKRSGLAAGTAGNAYAQSDENGEERTSFAHDVRRSG